ncbi:hypothetical protein BZA70DRAFT_283645 [Myxozyma melibiosi]|uniref:NAD(P)-binding domain-containing protein n=1 Tax=Myxozyma melibiosi TaxID=54550 RepID=A0ABR1F0Q0_9ASCO
MTSLLKSSRDTITVVGASGYTGLSFVSLLRAAPTLPTKVEKIVAITERPLSLPSTDPAAKTVINRVTADGAYAIPDETQIIFIGLDIDGRRGRDLEEQYRRQKEKNLQIARVARKQDIPTIVVVSSHGASRDSRFACARLQAEFELEIVKLMFERTIILRPGHMTNQSLKTIVGSNKRIPFLGWWIIDGMTCRKVELAKATMMILTKTAGERGVIVLRNSELRDLAREYDNRECECSICRQFQYTRP